jgi:hypothetical protein
MSYPKASYSLTGFLPNVLAGKIALISRAFRRNEGTSDGYEAGTRLIPDPKVHFDVEVALLGTVNADGTLVAQNIEDLQVQREFQIYVASGTINFIVGGAINLTNIPITTGVWRFKFNAPTLQVYKNGSVVSTINLNIGIQTSATATTTWCMRHAGTLDSYANHYSVVMANTVFKDSSEAITYSYDIRSQTDIIANKNTALGVEEIINGKFNNGTSNWSNDSGAILSVVNGFLEVKNGTGTYADQETNLVAGRQYKVSLDYVKGTGGSAEIRLGNARNDSSYFLAALNSDGYYEFIFKAESSTVFISVGYGIGSQGQTQFFDNISIREADGYATIINPNDSDWALYQQQATGKWLGQELITQAVWESPDNANDQWSFSNNQWSLDGDGDNNVLSLINSSDQPDRIALSGILTAINGELAVVQTSVFSLTATGSYYFEFNKEDVVTQQFKRATGPVTATLDKPSIREVLNVT